MHYETTIGLETHVQLATASKAFCADRNAFGAEPNRHISPLSLGYPGTLPFLNKKQVEFAVRLGLALGCKINLRSTFDRKNYFYADLPKGYQITQDENPICWGGGLPIVLASADAGEDAQRSGGSASQDASRSGRVVKIHHIHMEEDAGKSIHAEGEAFSQVDLNRAGTPLLEIVTEPDLHSAEEVDAFMSGMRQLVRWLGVSDGNMQEGSLRCDVNVSVRPTGQSELGTRCEIKNMNSMKFARQAVAYEVERQTGLLEKGEKVRQQTRQFDPATGRTSALRDKEDAHDYRYFPDPDLPPVVLEQAYVDRMRNQLGTLPWEAREKLRTLGLNHEDAGLLTEERDVYEAFLDRAEDHPAPVDLAKLWINRVSPWMRGRDKRTARREPPLDRADFGELHNLVSGGLVSAANLSSQLLPSLLEQPGPITERAKQLGLIQNTDTDFLTGLVDEVIAANQDKVTAYRNGKKGLIGFFMGEVMRKSQGKAEPKETQRLLAEKLA